MVETDWTMMEDIFSFNCPISLVNEPKSQCNIQSKSQLDGLLSSQVPGNQHNLITEQWKAWKKSGIFMETKEKPWDWRLIDIVSGETPHLINGMCNGEAKEDILCRQWCSLML